MACLMGAETDDAKVLSFDYLMVAQILYFIGLFAFARITYNYPALVKTGTHETHVLFWYALTKLIYVMNVVMSLTSYVIRLSESYENIDYSIIYPSHPTSVYVALGFCIASTVGLIIYHSYQHVRDYGWTFNTTELVMEVNAYQHLASEQLYASNPTTSQICEQSV